MSDHSHAVIEIRRAIRSWQNTIAESQSIIDKVNRDVRPQEELIARAKQCIAELGESIEKLEAPPRQDER